MKINKKFISTGIIIFIILYMFFICFEKISFKRYVDKNLTVIVRGVNERTFDKSIEYAQRIFGTENVFVVRNVRPLGAAVEKCIDIGLSENKKWTMVIDADTFLFKNRVYGYLKAVEEFSDKKVLSDDVVYLSLVYDKFSREIVERSFHLYRTKNLRYLKFYIEQSKKRLCPESSIEYMLDKMGLHTYMEKPCNFVIGLTDFFQSPKSLVQKYIVKARRSRNRDYKESFESIPWFQEMSKKDSDFIWALKGIEIESDIKNRKLYADQDYLNKIIDEYKLIFPKEKELTNFEIDKELVKHNRFTFQKPVFEIKKISIKNLKN